MLSLKVLVRIFIFAILILVAPRLIWKEPKSEHDVLNVSKRSKSLLSIRGRSPIVLYGFFIIPHRAITKSQMGNRIHSPSISVVAVDNQPCAVVRCITIGAEDDFQVSRRSKMMWQESKFWWWLLCFVLRGYLCYMSINETSVSVGRKRHCDPLWESSKYLRVPSRQCQQNISNCRNYFVTWMKNLTAQEWLSCCMSRGIKQHCFKSHNSTKTQLWLHMNSAYDRGWCYYVVASSCCSIFRNLILTSPHRKKYLRNIDKIWVTYDTSHVSIDPFLSFTRCSRKTDNLIRSIFGKHNYVNRQVLSWSTGAKFLSLMLYKSLWAINRIAKRHRSQLIYRRSESWLILKKWRAWSDLVFIRRYDILF